MELSFDSIKPGGVSKTTTHVVVSASGDVTAVPQHTPRPVPAARDLFEVAVWMDAKWATVAWAPARVFADTVAAAFLERWPIVQIWHDGQMVGEHSRAGDVTPVWPDRADRRA
jgi:hypothetical protein